MAAGEGQLREGISLFRHRLRGAAVVDDEQSWLALKTAIPKAKPIVQTFARVDNIHLGVTPHPRTTLVGDVVADGGAQDHDVAKDSAIGPLEELETKDCFAASRLSANDSRVGGVGQ